MNKQEALEQIEEIRLKINSADEICQKIDPLLPEGWESYFVVSWEGLLFANHLSNRKPKHSKNDFKKVCSLVKQIDAKEIHREPWIEDDFVLCLWGKFEYNGLRIDVRQFDTSECKIEYEEITEKKAIVSDDCLQTIGA